MQSLSASTFRLDIDDDFPDVEVLFAFEGGDPMPLSEQDVVLDPDEVLQGEVSLRFDGVPAADEHNFTASFIGEGPILTPTPTPSPICCRWSTNDVILVFDSEPMGMNEGYA